MTEINRASCDKKTGIGSSFVYPTQPQVAVGAFVFKNGRVLLVRRGHPPARGLWAIPGGRMKLGETLQEATEREILEETGLVVRALEPVYTFDVIERDGDDRIRYHYVIVDLAAEYVSGSLQPGDDALEARWVTPEEMETLDVSRRTRQVLERQFGFIGEK